MDLPNSSAGILAQPTRARLFTLVQEARAPASTDELARCLGLHANGVRRQLERLREAGLLERRRVRHGTGRPRDEWTLAPGASPGGERPHAYGDLARWLARAIPATPARVREVERTGREIGRELAPARADDPGDVFRNVFAALGFQPVVGAGPGDSITCELCNCPYRDSVRENQEVVCGLHRGLTQGLLDEVAPGSRLTRFEPHDPDRAGCMVEVATAAAGASGR